MCWAAGVALGPFAVGHGLAVAATGEGLDAGLDAGDLSSVVVPVVQPLNTSATHMIAVHFPARLIVLMIGRFHLPPSASVQADAAQRMGSGDGETFN